jgi:predicted DNA-binding transcriptional regulator AlpA
MVAIVKPGANSASDNQEVGRKAYSVEEFCASHGFTKPTFYEILKKGEGPRIMRVGRRVLISVEDAAAWRKSRAAATKQAVQP